MNEQLAALYKAASMDSQNRSPSKRLHEMTWEEVFDLCNKLAEQIKPDIHKFTGIVAIANGGIIPASILAYVLKLDLKIIKKPPVHFHQEGQLLIDDVYDTGYTIKDYIADERWYWQGTAALVLKPWCPYKPVYIGKETDDWIIFPWEKNE